MKRRIVAEALSERNALGKCAACQSTPQWLLPTIEGTDDLEVMAMVAPRDISLGFNFAPLICTNCGATRLFHLETLMKSTGGSNGAE
jgi:hypothetical protein